MAVVAKRLEVLHGVCSAVCIPDDMVTMKFDSILFALSAEGAEPPVSLEDLLTDLLPFPSASIPCHSILLRLDNKQPSSSKLIWHLYGNREQTGGTDEELLGWFTYGIACNTQSIRQIVKRQYHRH